MTYPLANPAVGSVEELEALVGRPIPAIAGKVRPSLDSSDREAIARSSLVFIATSDAAGRLDVSPKGDPGSVALVLDDQTLVIPERPGNRRADGFRNILENPRVGLLFVEPGRSETLRVAGRARIAVDEPFFDEMVVRGPGRSSRSSSTWRRSSCTARRPSCAPRPGSPTAGPRRRCPRTPLSSTEVPSLQRPSSVHGRRPSGGPGGPPFSGSPGATAAAAPEDRRRSDQSSSSSPSPQQSPSFRSVSVHLVRAPMGCGAPISSGTNALVVA